MCVFKNFTLQQKWKPQAWVRLSRVAGVAKGDSSGIREKGSDLAYVLLVLLIRHGLGVNEEVKEWIKHII